MNILVTGVSSGIGRALTKRLLSHGHTVWGISRREPDLSDFEVLERARFYHSAVDVTASEEVKEACAEMDRRQFLPDAVVLNAGIYPHDSDTLFRFDIARKVLDTNVNGALVFVDIFLDRFLARGRGQFVAVSSILALRPDPLGASYAASKAAVMMAFRSLGLRYRNGVQFKTIVFGPIDTGKQKKPFFAMHIQTEQKAATTIERVLSRKGRLFFDSRLAGLVFRATAWVPDSAFNAVTNVFRR